MPHDIDDLEGRLRTLEILVAKHSEELAGRKPLVHKAYDGVLKLQTVLEGTFGSSGFMSRVIDTLKSYEAEFDRIKMRQYLIFGGIGVVALIEPIFLRYILPMIGI